VVGDFFLHTNAIAHFSRNSNDEQKREQNTMDKRAESDTKGSDYSQNSDYSENKKSADYSEKANEMDYSAKMKSSDYSDMRKSSDHSDKSNSDVKNKAWKNSNDRSKSWNEVRDNHISSEKSSEEIDFGNSWNPSRKFSLRSTNDANNEMENTNSEYAEYKDRSYDYQQKDKRNKRDSSNENKEKKKESKGPMLLELIGRNLDSLNSLKESVANSVKSVRGMLPLTFLRKHLLKQQQ
jgi:hypothetical protein